MKKEQKKLKDQFLMIRLTSDRKELYKKVASKIGLSLTSWIIIACNQAVKSFLESNSGIQIKISRGRNDNRKDKKTLRRSLKE